MHFFLRVLRELWEFSANATFSDPICFELQIHSTCAVKILYVTVRSDVTYFNKNYKCNIKMPMIFYLTSSLAPAISVKRTNINKEVKNNNLFCLTL